MNDGTYYLRNFIVEPNINIFFDLHVLLGIRVLASRPLLR
jgi:hypothetical protein